MIQMDLVSKVYNSQKIQPKNYGVIMAKVRGFWIALYGSTTLEIQEQVGQAIKATDVSLM
jgi:hypothetical protein